MTAVEQEIKSLEEKKSQVHGTKCEVFTRVVGFLRPTDSFNKGKKEEFNDRVALRTNI